MGSTTSPEARPASSSARGEPAGLLDLGRVQRQGGVESAGGEAEHHGPRKPPGLGADIADGAEPDADLLEDLAVDRLLQGFACLGEAGEDRHPALGPGGLPAQQQPVVGVGDRDDHRRVDPREQFGAATGADPARPGPRHRRRGPALAAERGPAVPVGEGDRGERQLQRGGVQAVHHRAQSRRVRQLGAGLDEDRGVVDEPGQQVPLGEVADGRLQEEPAARPGQSALGGDRQHPSPRRGPRLGDPPRVGAAILDAVQSARALPGGHPGNGSPSTRASSSARPGSEDGRTTAPAPTS